MSRVGKRPVEVPSNVKVSVQDRAVEVEGPKGKLSFTHRAEVLVAWSEDDRAIVCTVPEGDENSRGAKTLWGTTRSIVQNMVFGVANGYEKKLKIEGVGWNGSVAGQNLELNLGFAHPVKLPIPEGVAVTAVKQDITLQSADKQAIGQFAAKIRSQRPPEPYNGKGIRYDDEVVKRKQGKQFGA